MRAFEDSAGRRGHTRKRSTRRSLMMRLVILALLAGALSVGCQQSSSKSTSSTSSTETSAGTTSAAPQAQATTPEAAPAGATRTTGSGLQIEDVQVGTGATAETGKTVSVLYTGRFTDGTEFDSSAKHGNQPMDVVLGAGR